MFVFIQVRPLDVVTYTHEYPEEAMCAECRKCFWGVYSRCKLSNKQMLDHTDKNYSCQEGHLWGGTWLRLMFLADSRGPSPSFLGVPWKTS